jgi:hypothetical protein
MLINTLKPENKTITVDVPLTTTSGKTRVKQRNSMFDYGLPFASRTNPFNQNNYIEWQIGYDATVPRNVSNFKKEKFKNFVNTTLKENYFTGDNGNKKTLYELSEYLYYFVKWEVISEKTLRELMDFLVNIAEENLLDQHKHCQVKRTHPVSKTINTIDFDALTVEYPQLIYRFGDYEIIAEITIREKQRAVGTQPMLYFCFPVTELQAEQPLIGRCADIKEFAKFEFNKDNAFIVLEMMKIFGMLSASHRHDTVQIIQTILDDL